MPSAAFSLMRLMLMFGDYISGVPDTQSALCPLDSIVADLITASQKINGTDHKTRNDLKKELNNAKSKGSPSQQAQAMLDVLIKRMPKILESSSTVKAALY